MLVMLRIHPLASASILTVSVALMPVSVDFQAPHTKVALAKDGGAGGAAVDALTSDRSH